MSDTTQASALLLGCQSWDDVRQALENAPEATKGSVFEALVQAYLRLDAKYDFKDVWSTHGEVPKPVLQLLNLFHRDVTGIDLVAEAKSGKYWAIQAKYHHDEKSSLSRDEATGLIAGLNRAHGEFELGLICTTANGRSPHLAGEPGIEYLMGDVWRGLDAEFFARLHAHLKGTIPPPPALKEPRPHQREALQSIISYFGDHARGKVVMPCATGKSLIGFWAAEELGARRALVAVPNLSLVRQLLKDWTEQSVAAGRRPRWVVVCSDDSVADSVTARDLGVRVDTDPAEVARWLRADEAVDVSVAFTTYQSGRVLADAAREAGIGFDVGIFDEAHRTAGREGAPFAYLLPDDHVRIRKRIFMTATPRIYKGKDRDDIISMDDPEVFGGDAFKMTFLEAMDRKLISNLTNLAVFVAEGEIKRLLKDRRFVRLQDEHRDRTVLAEDLVSALALRKAMQKYPIRQTLGFYSSKKLCRLASEIQQLIGDLFPEYGPLDVFHVEGDMTSGERDQELRAFKASKHALLTNVRVFVEGVDCPSMDAVMFANPRQSVLDIVQGVGRALRRFEGKESGFAIVPTVIQDDGTPSDVAYAEVVRVATALGSENEVLLAYFAAIAQGRPWTGRRVFEVLGDAEVGIKVDLEKVNQTIAVRSYERTTRRVTLEDYHALARKRGFTFLGRVVPRSTGDKAQWQCREGHTWSAVYQAIRGGSGCPHCAGLARKTLDDYRALATKRGFVFVGEAVPKNAQVKGGPWQCPMGHRWDAAYSWIYMGNGCPHCAGQARKTIEDYRILAKERGFECLTDEAPPNNHTRVTWRCRNGHSWQAGYHSIRRGSGCPRCGGKERKTVDDYRALAKRRGFECLATEVPPTTHAKVEWQCEKGHRWDARYSAISRGTGCPDCAGVTRRTIDDYRTLAKERGLECLAAEAPLNTQTLVAWRCTNGHRWDAKYNTIYNGSGCPYCAGVRRKTIADYHALANERGFKCLATDAPPNVHTKVPWQCARGHRWEAKYNTIYNGHGCPCCGGRTPKTIADYQALASEREFECMAETAPRQTTEKVTWRCRIGHSWQASFKAISRSRWCPHCWRERGGST